MERLSLLPPAFETVRALYDYQQRNNDELTFKKGDLITLTQTPDGGWYEGTLAEITGWFPSNYVEPVLKDEVTDAEANLTSIDSYNNSFPVNSENAENRKLVIKEIIETEAAFVLELSQTHQKFLLPLLKSNILPERDVSTVVSVVSQVIAVHNQFLTALKTLEQRQLNRRSMKIGGVFLEHSVKIKDAHHAYCGLHPKFISILEKNKDPVNHFMKTITKSSVDTGLNGSVLLTQKLSFTFQRLDKYPALLQELQRYTSESDADRGDTQRAGFLFREFVSSSLEIRRRKEMELEVMLGNIKNWPENSSHIETLGQIVNMGPVIVMHTPNDGDVMQKDRYLVLFEKDILLLSISREMTSFNFEFRLNLNQITLRRLSSNTESTEVDVFELLVTNGSSSNITSEEAGSYVFKSPSGDEVKTWILVITNCKRNAGSEATNTPIHTSNSGGSGGRSAAGKIKSETSSLSSGSWHDSHHVTAHYGQQQSQADTTQTKEHSHMRPSELRSDGYWSTHSLLSHGPLRIVDVTPQSFTAKSHFGSLKKGSSLNKGTSPSPVPPEMSSSPADDMAILQVIESYCSTGIRTRNHNNNARDVSASPQIMSRKSDELNESNIDLKTLFEEVKKMKKDVRSMKSQMNLMNGNLEKEKRGRKRLKQFLVDHVLQLSPNNVSMNPVDADNLYD